VIIPLNSMIFSKPSRKLLDWPDPLWTSSNLGFPHFAPPKQQQLQLQKHQLHYDNKNNKS